MKVRPLADRVLVQAAAAGADRSRRDPARVHRRVLAGRLLRPADAHRVVDVPRRRRDRPSSASTLATNGIGTG